MNKIQLISLSGLFFLLTVPAFAGDNWTVVIDEDPLSQSSQCLLESVTHTIEDGQTDTPVKLVYNGKHIVATSKSTLDLSYPNVGLKVATHEPYKIDRVHKKTIAVFSTQASSIHKAFIAGKKAQLALGFWPTWPQTHTRIIEFSLIGYTKAHEQFVECQTSGKLP